MGAIIIKSNSKDNLRLIRELAKKIGEKVTVLSEDQMEEMALGTSMKKIKTGKDVPLKSVLKRLQSIK